MQQNHKNINIEAHAIHWDVPSWVPSKMDCTAAPLSVDCPYVQSLASIGHWVELSLIILVV
jgi:hypothetical protein